MNNETASLLHWMPQRPRTRLCVTLGSKILQPLSSSHHEVPSPVPRAQRRVARPSHPYRDRHLPPSPLRPRSSSRSFYLLRHHLFHSSIILRFFFLTLHSVLSVFAIFPLLFIFPQTFRSWQASCFVVRSPTFSRIGSPVESLGRVSSADKSSLMEHQVFVIMKFLKRPRVPPSPDLF